MSLSNVYLLQRKTICFLEKTELLWEALTSLFYHQFFSPIFHKEEYSSLSLSRSKNSTKSSLYLSATSSIGERVLDLDEFGASEEDLESVFIESPCNLKVLVGMWRALVTTLDWTLYLASLPSSLFTSKTFIVFTHRRFPRLENFYIFL